MANSPLQTPDSPSEANRLIVCTECRAPMTGRYFVVSERPICARCRVSYARKIALTDGTGALWRVGLRGALVALLGTALLAVVVTVFPAARMFPLIPIGYLIGKVMMRALEGYSDRRYQYLAVALTYLCFLAGNVIPAARAEREARELRAANQIKMQGTLATQSTALNDELASLGADPSGSTSARRGAQRSAAAHENAGPGPGLALVMLLLLPLLAMMQFGMAFSAVGVMALGYAFYQAWKQTDGQGMHLELSGPFRVGEGPIAAR
jgi:hypothetical protein